MPNFTPKIDLKIRSKSIKSVANCGAANLFLCSGGDLNPHALRHTPLKRTCLPFHHPSDTEEGNL